jgi:hypothetical protein
MAVEAGAVQKELLEACMGQKWDRIMRHGGVVFLRVW